MHKLGTRFRHPTKEISFNTASQLTLWCVRTTFMPCFTKEGTEAQNSEITNPRAPGTLCSQDSRPSGPQNPVEPLFLVQMEMYIPAVRISKT